MTELDQKQRQQRLSSQRKNCPYRKDFLRCNQVDGRYCFPEEMTVAIIDEIVKECEAITVGTTIPRFVQMGTNAPDQHDSGMSGVGSDYLHEDEKSKFPGE